MKSDGLDSLKFDNSFTRSLPADPESSNQRRQVIGACYSRIQPTTVTAPRLVSYSREVADLLDLTPSDCESERFARVFAGNELLETMDPHATCYGGHQFGAWAGQLGDGRAINLGEIVNRRGERWWLQLKGAGATPYSRTADGLAVLRSSVREFLCSEAMHHLGVPTTRALSLVTTGELVVRDMFYDGHPREEPGAVVCRVAPTFTRFGNFQIFAARRETDVLRQLVDYTISTDFPELGEPSADAYVAWFDEVCRRTMDMINHWMRVGFVHGVMNTDNMSILGQTIDYGPYGWLDDFNPDWTPNTTDATGRRYRYGAQPQIALWNLAQFAGAIGTLLDETKPLQDVLNRHVTEFAGEWNAMMARKLGLKEYRPDADDALIAELTSVLRLVETDMTLFFRGLADVPGDTRSDVSAVSDERLLEPLMDAYYEPTELTGDVRSRVCDWIRSYVRRLREDRLPDTERRDRMNAVNPKYVLRNYLAQLAIDKAETGDPSLVNELLDVLRRPYDEQSENERFAEKRPDWARHRPGCSMLSCSS